MSPAKKNQSEARIRTGGTAAERSAPQAEGEAMAFLMQVAEVINSTLELDTLLGRVADRVKQRIDYDNFGILLLDDLGKELSFRFAVGYPEDVVKFWRFGPGQGLVGTAAQTGEAVRVDNVEEDSRYIKADKKMRSELVIPLIVKSRTIGVLDVASTKPENFSESDQYLLTLLAGRLANAIEQARLYENLQTQARTLSLMHEVSRELTSILDREELLKKVAQTVKRLIDFKLFSVLLFNEETQLLDHVFSLHSDERVLAKGSCPLGHGICGTAAALRQSVRVSNVQLDPRYIRSSEALSGGMEMRSELAVPLVTKDRLIGAIDLESTEYNAFSEENEQMLSTLASYIAIALENALLYEQVRKGEQRLEKDLDTAREIQKGLLPDTPPRIPGLEIGFAYEPARQLGGDLYDFLPHSEGRLAILVGDVTGKGTPAALYGSLAVGILRGHIMENPCEPSALLEEVNDHLRQPRLENRYLALSLALYDSNKKELVVANAGFPQPWLVRDGEAEEIKVEGVPLGLLPDIRYEQKTIPLQKGDTVIFCSDGIHEAFNMEQEELGLGRLEAIIAGLAGSGTAAEIAHGILGTTDRYAAGSKHADDRTVVVLKVTE
jgi:sigma-B regulation protein RsbU (phosphoserine phosphatase)